MIPGDWNLKVIICKRKLIFFTGRPQCPGGWDAPCLETSPPQPESKKIAMELTNVRKSAHGRCIAETDPGVHMPIFSSQIQEKLAPDRGFIFVI